ncbi:MAG TPA: hypothetical protein VH020_08615 [Stellaceae bacterium]|jgi:hypothetical protein|nr:hypothetical protein [Stellaceae bacterium]
MAANEICAPAPLARANEDMPLPYWRVVGALGALGTVFILLLSALR